MIYNELYIRYLYILVNKIPVLKVVGLNPTETTTHKISDYQLFINSFYLYKLSNSP